MKLKVRTERIVDSFDLDTLVKETYSKPYCFQQQNGCKDRGTFKFTVPEQGYDYENYSLPDKLNGEVEGVSFKSWLERDPKEWNGEPDDAFMISLFWERNFYPEFQTLANDLYAKGLIEAGDYTLEIDW